MLIPYIGLAVGCKSATVPFKEMNPVWKAVTLGGGGLILAGAALALIGNSGCNRVIATYNDGVGVTYSF